MRATLWGVRRWLFALLLIAACSESKRQSQTLPHAVVDAGVVAHDAETSAPDAADGFPDASEPSDSGVVDTPDAGEDICVSGPDKPHRSMSRVTHGTRSPTFVPLGPDQIMAVVGITEGTPTDAICSGTLIAPTWVLTAKHCTEGEPASGFWALFGEDDINPELAIAVIAKHEHPDHDMTLLELDRDATTQIMVRPIPIPLFDLSRADFGRMLEQAGFGQTETGNTNGRFFVAEPLYDFTEANDRDLSVDGMNMHGVCFGDSGGPSMAIAPEGDVRVVGALSYGDESCMGIDTYARTDYARTWIEQYTGPTPGSGPQPCNHVDAVGYCSNQTASATYCANDVLTTDTCTTGQVCGWDVRAGPTGGWRCVPAASDPCGGIGFYGACNGDTLSWCDRGTVYTRPCAMCGERCVELDSSFGFDCQVNLCGNIDYLGHCIGDTAEWCNRAGMLEQVDCGAQMQVCRYIDMDVGYYCADP